MKFGEQQAVTFDQLVGLLSAGWPLAIAIVIDAVHREWPSAWHPVAWLGHAAAFLAARLHVPPAAPRWQLAAGTVLVGLITTGAVASVGLVRALSPTTAFTLAVDAIVLAACFTLSGLIRAADALRVALQHSDIDAARAALRSLCSRDPRPLGAEDLAAAGIESVAENTSDSFIAPLFWYAAFGWPGAVVYRSVNTLDAMYGYRDEREWFGKPAARLDDVLNLVPSRLTAVLLWLAGPFDGRVRGWRVFLRDRGNTASPNAGQPMAMMAGLLRIRLTKRGCYALGDAERFCAPERIADACRIAMRAGLLWAAVTLVLVVIS